MTLALDISHHTQNTSGPLTNEQLHSAWEQGVRVFRPNVTPQQTCVEQIDAIVNSGLGFKIWPYSYYYFGTALAKVQSDKAFIQRIRDHGIPIEKFAIDIEDTNPNFTAEQRIDITQQLIDSFVGFCNTDLYSAYWYWTQYMQDTHKFNYMPLWFAHYNNVPTLDLQYSFGGWTKGTMKQFAGDTYFAGIWCDVNYFEEPISPPNPINPTISVSFPSGAVIKEPFTITYSE